MTLAHAVSSFSTLYKNCCKLLSNNGLLPQPVEINRRFDGFTLMYARDGKAVAFKLLADIARRAQIQPVQGADPAAIQHYRLDVNGPRFWFALVNVLHRVGR